MSSYYRFNATELTCRTPVVLSVLSLLILLAVFVLPVRAQGVPPAFELRFIGTGSPTKINIQRTVIGTRTVGSAYLPLVSTNGESWSVLPVPSGSMSTFPTDINSNGVIVGVSFSPQWNPVSVRWTLTAGTYNLEVLPVMVGDTASYATAINDLGQIVGARSSLGYQPTGTGWVYSDQQGFRRLSDLGFWIVPRDINNSGIVIGGQERLDLATGQVDVTGQGPANYNAITSIAINSSGMMVGSSSLRSSSLNIVSVFRYHPGSGWTFVAGSSRYTTANDINNIGDISYGELGAGLYLKDLGTFALSGLLSPETIANGWTITGNGSYINDNREVATVGRNTVTGESGTVLLLPVGAVPPPMAPTNLRGDPHPATRMEPFNSIELTWVNTSPLTQSWELQRSVHGSTNWETLSLVPPGTASRHSDTTVGVNVTYDYRVRAVGLGGPSLWSDTITVTSPLTPLDTTPPVVTILEPTDGASVSGIVRVRARATDNVAIEYQDISFWNQYTGQQVIIGSSSADGEISFNWDTSQLTPATYQLTAFANDTMGNFSRSNINVSVTRNVGLVIRVSSITLYSVRTSAGTQVNGDVRVVDGLGNPVQGATVSVIWRLPRGRMMFQTGTSNDQGKVTFSVLSVAGTYRLTITNVAKPGYEFAGADSRLTAEFRLAKVE